MRIILNITVFGMALTFWAGLTMAAMHQVKVMFPITAEHRSQ